MKILFVTPRFSEDSGGDGLYAFKLAGELLRLGHFIDIISIEGSNFIFICCELDANNRLVCKSKMLLSNIGQNFLSQNYFSLRALKSLKFVFEKSKPDFVHVHGIHQYFTISSAYILRELQIPSLMTIHDYKLLCGNSSFFSDRTKDVCTKCLHKTFLDPIFMRCKKKSILQSAGAALQMILWNHLHWIDCIQHFHAPSQFVFDLITENQRFTNKTSMLRYPVLDKKHDIQTKLESKIKLVFIGRVVPHKGGTIFAEAVKYFDVPIEVFGDGPELSDMKFILRNNPRVRFFGWTNRDQMLSEIGPMAIVILPYLAYETFCFTVLEVMRRGACVVTSNRGAIPELVLNGVNGIVVKEPTVEQFKMVIEELLANDKLVIQLGNKAMEIDSVLGNLESHGNQMLQLYQSVHYSHSF